MTKKQVDELRAENVALRAELTSTQRRLYAYEDNPHRVQAFKHFCQMLDLLEK